MDIFLKRYMNRQSNLNQTKQLFFLERLDRLLNSGYSLLNALEVIKWDKSLEATASAMINALTAGKTVDEAFQLTKFHSTIISYLYFVRINGDIQTSINKCIQMFEHRIKNVNKFKQVIRYPFVLCSFFIILLLFLKFSVLPAFMEIFQTADASAKTVMLSINLIDMMTTAVFFFIIIAILIFIYWLFIKKNLTIDKQISIYEKIPIFRSILQMQTSYYFATHMAMFLKTGMSMKDVLYHMSKQNELKLIAYYAELMMMELQNGFYIDRLLEHLTLIDKQISAIFKKNNNIEDLEQDLTAYADFMAEIIERKIIKIISFIQPVFFTVLAVLIVFTYLTLMWPMFQLINTV